MVIIGIIGAIAVVLGLSLGGIWIKECVDAALNHTYEDDAD